MDVNHPPPHNSLHSFTALLRFDVWNLPTRTISVTFSTDFFQILTKPQNLIGQFMYPEEFKNIKLNGLFFETEMVIFLYSSLV